MQIQLDHFIVHVNDLGESVAFYTSVLGLVDEGRDGPFAVLRVSPDLTIQLAPWGTKGNEHYAFALSATDFAAVFERIEQAGVPYGDAFDAVGNMAGPGLESGARGMGKSIYFFDPNRHLLEIRHYEA
jgi:catechol 2,3-dioxygenase-like lactoylglutathione lyase family enzyme